MEKAPKLKSALLIIDVQNDFLPGGAMAVPQGNEIIPVINQIQPYFSLIVATKDWHPSNHVSFASVHGKEPGEGIQLSTGYQQLWPEHCIQESLGAQFSPFLHSENIRKVFYKGINASIDSYSAFYDNAHLSSTGLAEYLHALDVATIYVVGLTTEYCVKDSVLDALNLGFHVTVILDACQGINLKKGDAEFALNEMEKKGALLMTSSMFLDQRSQN